MDYFEREATRVIDELGLREMQEEERHRHRADELGDELADDERQDRPQIYELADVSLHFRIGDVPAAGGKVLGSSYYKAAFARLTELTEGRRLSVRYFYEAGDEAAVQHIVAMLSKQFPSLAFSPVDTAISDWQQLLHMSLSRYNIIANR
jgi:hypothetical protein